MRARLATFVTRHPYDTECVNGEFQQISDRIEEESGVTVEFTYLEDDRHDAVVRSTEISTVPASSRKDLITARSVPTGAAGGRGERGRQVQVTVYLGSGRGTLTYLPLRRASLRQDLIDGWTRQEIENENLRLYGTHFLKFHGEKLYYAPKLWEKDSRWSRERANAIENLSEQDIKTVFFEWFELLKSEVSQRLHMTVFTNVSKGVKVMKRRQGGVVVRFRTPSALGDDVKMQNAVHTKLLRSDVGDIYGKWNTVAQAVQPPMPSPS